MAFRDTAARWLQCERRKSCPLLASVRRIYGANVLRTRSASIFALLGFL